MKLHAKNVALLAAAQGLLLSNNILLIAINGLLGLQLVSDKRWATLPITTYVIGGALVTLPAAFFMKRFGRRAGFMLGAALGMLGAMISALAVAQGSFGLLCLGTVFAGGYNAFGQQYRFAAADAAPPEWRAKAISITLAGGILGGWLGPQAGLLSRNLLAPTYIASYGVLFFLAALAMWLAGALRIPAISAAQRNVKGRPMLQIAREPAFPVAVLAAAAGYGVMNMLMTATPLAMDICGLSFADTSFILQWHVIGMFAPSFFTGFLIKRVGVLNVLLAGAMLMFGCVAIALSGVSLAYFWWALVLLGIGWNFLFIGGTTLLTQVCSPQEQAKVQGTNDFIVLATQAVTSLAAGLLVTSSGWVRLNEWVLPIIALTALASAALWRIQRGTTRQIGVPCPPQVFGTQP